jgi:CubicO group peptidase (beta-lactamase class C family)
MESVSGGAHWGGGMFISARDHARLGYLIQRRGTWGGRQLLSEAWIDALTTPCAINPIYGLLWWLNTDRAYYAAAPETSFFAVGMGTNLIWIDPALDLLVVARWVNKERVGDLIASVMKAMR